MAPNGYNLREGGSCTCPPKDRKRKYSEEDFRKIVEDIRNRSLSWDVIGEKWKTCGSQIRAINFGEQYFHEDLEYPIRDNSNLWGIFQSPEEIENIHQEILSQKMNFEKLAEKYHCGAQVISKINRGDIKAYRLEHYSYPLVDTSNQNLILFDAQKELVELLLNSALSMAEIANKLNLSYSQVRNFNAGLYFHQEGLEYPLKKEFERYYITPEEIEKIKEMLYEGKTNFQIQKVVPCSQNVIARINNGRERYKEENQLYPIRFKNS